MQWRRPAPATAGPLRKATRQSPRHEDVPTPGHTHCGYPPGAVISRAASNDRFNQSRRQNRSSGPEGDAIRVSHSTAEPALDAAGVAEAAQRFGRAEPPPAPDPGAGELLESG